MAFSKFLFVAATIRTSTSTSAIAPTGLIFFLQSPEHLHLNTIRQVSHLIKKQRPAIRFEKNRFYLPRQK